jgi:hypothetical protein
VLSEEKKNAEALVQVALTEASEGQAAACEEQAACDEKAEGCKKQDSEEKSEDSALQDQAEGCEGHTKDVHVGGQAEVCVDGDKKADGCEGQGQAEDCEKQDSEEKSDDSAKQGGEGCEGQTKDVHLVGQGEVCEEQTMDCEKKAEGCEEEGQAEDCMTQGQAEGCEGQDKDTGGQAEGCEEQLEPENKDEAELENKDDEGVVEIGGDDVVVEPTGLDTPKIGAAGSDTDFGADHPVEQFESWERSNLESRELREQAEASFLSDYNSQQEMDALSDFSDAAGDGDDRAAQVVPRLDDEGAEGGMTEDMRDKFAFANPLSIPGFRDPKSEVDSNVGGTFEAAHLRRHFRRHFWRHFCPATNSGTGIR